MSTLTIALPLDNPSVNSRERLTFTFFISVVLHLIIILGVGFSILSGAPKAPVLEITLAQHSSMDAPDDADFLAQHHQKASGTLDVKKQLTTPSVSDFADTEINRVEPLPQIQTTAIKPNREKQLISTTAPQTNKSSKKPDDQHPEEQIALQGEEKTVVDYTAEIASLHAKLDRQRQQFSKRPRVKTLTSAATRQAIDAEYLFSWQERIEMIGNLNYPEEARRKKLYGDLRLLVTILPNGAVMKVELLKSSGSIVLDQAAMRIVRMAAPYPPFPDEMKREIDRLEIIRTWRFQKGDVFSTEN